MTSSPLPLSVPSPSFLPRSCYGISFLPLFSLTQTPHVADNEYAAEAVQNALSLFRSRKKLRLMAAGNSARSKDKLLFHYAAALPEGAKAIDIEEKEKNKEATTADSESHGYLVPVPSLHGDARARPRTVEEAQFSYQPEQINELFQVEMSGRKRAKFSAQPNKWFNTVFPWELPADYTKQYPHNDSPDPFVRCHHLCGCSSSCCLVGEPGALVHSFFGIAPQRISALGAHVTSANQHPNCQDSFPCFNFLCGVYGVHPKSGKVIILHSRLTKNNTNKNNSSTITAVNSDPPVADSSVPVKSSADDGQRSARPVSPVYSDLDGAAQHEAEHYEDNGHIEYAEDSDAEHYTQGNAATAGSDADADADDGHEAADAGTEAHSEAEAEADADMDAEAEGEVAEESEEAAEGDGEADGDGEEGDEAMYDDEEEHMGDEAEADAEADGDADYAAAGDDAAVDYTHAHDVSDPAAAVDALDTLTVPFTPFNNSDAGAESIEETQSHADAEAEAEGEHEHDHDGVDEGDGDDLEGDGDLDGDADDDGDGDDLFDHPEDNASLAGESVIDEDSVQYMAYPVDLIECLCEQAENVMAILANTPGLQRDPQVREEIKRMKITVQIVQKMKGSQQIQQQQQEQQNQHNRR